MSLRTRLVVALVVVSTIGLGVFGLVTVSLYRQSLFDQLDSQLSAAARPQSDRLVRNVAQGADASCTETIDIREPDAPFRGGGGGSFDSEARLFVGGTQVACLPSLTQSGSPALTTDLKTTSSTRFRTVSSAKGGGSWRVFAVPINKLSGPGSLDESPSDTTNQVLIVARPTGSINDSLARLIHIELAAGAGLLSVLAIGAWLVLRRGLRPLEQMAGEASNITAGNLSMRVSRSDAGTEIGQVGGAINTMLDGIEDAFAEREATEARLRQFLADAAHELRTPITSIQGFAELFRIGDTPDLPVIMSRIESESARMNTLVEDLMLLARLDRVRDSRVDPVDLSVLAADACTDAALLDPSCRITLDAPEPVVVHGDADHLRQGIANLVTNAVRHTPEGTAIEVTTRLEPTLARVTVRDHGPGLSGDGLAHAFDRFWQADASRVGTGAGLGLAIVAGIAAEHRGDVTVANAPDGGAIFTLTLAR